MVAGETEKRVKTAMIDFPNWRQKQQILFTGKGTREARLKVARDLVDREMCAEAIDYLEVEPDPELLRRLLERSLETGDAYLYRRSVALLGQKPTLEEWGRVAERAASLGKEAFARMARAEFKNLETRRQASGPTAGPP